MKNYINIEELPEDYTIEQAIKDNCFVVSYNEVVSKDKEAIDKFVEYTEQGNEAMIRIVTYSEWMEEKETMVIDLYYKEGKYHINANASRAKSKNDFYRSGKKIVKNEIGDKNVVIGLDDGGRNLIPICIIKGE